MGLSASQLLACVSPELEHCLSSSEIDTPVLFAANQIQRETIWIRMRDGVRLATDLYRPPVFKAPALATRSPYGRANPKMIDTFMALAQRGYVVVSQDCRGTGESEPDHWDYYMYEPEDGFDCVQWISEQSWFDGFIGALGSSYVAQTQWCMATHPRMSTIVPEVSGLGIAVNTARLYMFCNAYARSVGRGAQKISAPFEGLERLILDETLAGGYFNEPLHTPFSESLLSAYPHLRSLEISQAKRWLWALYCAMSSSQRAQLIKQALSVSSISILEIESLPAIFGQRISHDAHTLPHVSPATLCHSIRAPALMITGWYDWALNDALATWELLVSEADEPTRSRSRLIITPSAHNTPGYHEGSETHPELRHSHRMMHHVQLLLRWYASIREDELDSWPKVIYYLMGANTWCCASAWPPREAQTLTLWLGPNGTLSTRRNKGTSSPDSYTYDPEDPTPTVGGSIVSYVYRPGSVDVSEVQKRSDVVTYTTEPLTDDLDVVGPLRLILYASSSAIDTDFVARLSDVFADGRVIQLQSSLLRARYRNPDFEPQWLEPGHIYRFEIDLWATANRFKMGHCLRLDISSADFPKFDRNANRGDELGSPVSATQKLYCDEQHPSQLVLSVLGSEGVDCERVAEGINYPQ